MPDDTVLRDCSGACSPPLLYPYMCNPKLFNVDVGWVYVGPEVEGEEPCRQSSYSDCMAVEVPYGDRVVLGRWRLRDIKMSASLQTRMLVHRIKLPSNAVCSFASPSRTQ